MLSDGFEIQTHRARNINNSGRCTAARSGEREQMEFRHDAARSEVVKDYLRLARLHKHKISKEGMTWMPEPSRGICVTCSGVLLKLKEWIFFRHVLRQRYAEIAAVFSQAFVIHTPGVARAIAMAWYDKHLLCAHHVQQCAICLGFRCSKCTIPIIGTRIELPCSCQPDEAVWM